MPLQCKIVEGIQKAKSPGDMWNVVRNGVDNWHVILPNGGVFNIHAKSADGTGWTVTGEAPNFTVSPSIKQLDIRREDGTIWKQGWHGYLQNGVLTDDLEGRTYHNQEGLK